MDCTGICLACLTYLTYVAYVLLTYLLTYLYAILTYLWDMQLHMLRLPRVCLTYLITCMFSKQIISNVKKTSGEYMIAWRLGDKRRPDGVMELTTLVKSTKLESPNPEADQL